MVGIKEKRVVEGERADSGQQGNSKKMDVGDQDDGTLVGDSGLSRDSGESSPLFEVEEGIRVRDKAMALAVCRGADEEPTEHGVTPVPLLGLDSWTPSPLGKLGELVFKVLDSIIVVKHARGIDGIQGAVRETSGASGE